MHDPGRALAPSSAAAANGVAALPMCSCLDNYGRRETIPRSCQIYNFCPALLTAKLLITGFGDHHAQTVVAITRIAGAVEFTIRGALAVAVPTP